MNNNIITILCSGIGLGEYNPGLIMSARLKKMGFSTDIVVLESLYVTEKRLRIQDTKIAFQRNFKIAQIAQKFMKDIKTILDNTLIIALLNKWKAEKRKRFIVFSGFWSPVIEQYLSDYTNPSVSVDLFHTDSGSGASWIRYNITHPCCRHLQLGDHITKTMYYNINISDDIIQYKKRCNQILIHGGGWGIGTYLEKIPELIEKKINLDIVVNDIWNIPKDKSNNRYFMNDPQWNPWEKDDNGVHYFTPFGKILNNNNIKYRNNPNYPEIYKIVRRDKAVICKTGGGALIDSLSSTTPIIILEPYGKFEHNNALLWESLGFGIQYNKWIESGCSMTILEELHENLLVAKPKIPDYVDEFFKSDGDMLKTS